MRRGVEAGYFRGEETKTRILDSAVDLFGARGFDGVTTRELAAAADVPTASLIYYFENKRGLYIACLERLQASGLQAMGPALEVAELLLMQEEVEPGQLIDAYCALQEALIEHMIGGSDRGARALFVVRHELPSEAGAGQFKSENSEGALRLLACSVQLIRRISSNSLDAASALIVAGLINGQITAINISRNRLAEGGWDITAERLRWLKQTIRKQTKAMLQAHRVTVEDAKV